MYEILKARFKSLNDKQTFSEGDIVEWKPGMKNRRSESPMIVTEVLDAPITDTNRDAGSPYFMELLDIKLGVTDPDGDFIEFHYDSRRFQKATEQ